METRNRHIVVLGAGFGGLTFCQTFNHRVARVTLFDRQRIQFWEGNMMNNCLFPETVGHKSCTATIYHQLHRGAERFEVRYYDVDGSMQRLTFPTYSSAKKFADTAVKEIAANRQHFVTLRDRDAFDYQTAIETLTPLGLSIA